MGTSNLIRGNSESAREQPPPDRTAPRSGPTLRTTVVLLVLAVAVPLFLLGCGAVWELYRAETAATDQALAADARSGALLVDAEFVAAERTLLGLAASASLTRDNLPDFRQEMLAAAKRSGASAINLVGPDGRIRATTLWPLNERPDAQPLPNMLRALNDGGPAISNLYRSPTVGVPSVGVAVAVPGPGIDTKRPSQVLGLVLPREALRTALSRLPLPPGASALVVDRDRTVVATTLTGDGIAGHPVADQLAASLADDSGTVSYGGQPSGDEVYVGAVARAPMSGYRVAVTMPESAVAAASGSVLRSVVLIGMAVLAASLVIATLLAARLADALRRLGVAESDPAIARPGVREIRDVADALARKTREREQAMAELRALFARSPVGVVRGDAGGRVYDANDAFLAIVGMSRAELEAGLVRWDNLTPPEWIGRDEAAIAEAVRLGGCTPYQKEYGRPDGTRIPILTFFAFDNQATGSVAAFVVDLSAWTATEADLARAHEQMRLAIGAARMYFFDWNLVTDKVEWSEGLEAALGLPPGGFGGSFSAFRDLVHPEDLPRVEATLNHAFAQDVAYEAEFRMRRTDGSQRWVLARGTVLRDGTGRPVRLVGVDLDITDRKEAELDLRRSKDALRRITNAARMATFEAENPASGAFAKVSANFRALFGLPETASIDFPTVLACVHPDDREGFLACHQRLAEQGGSFSLDFRVVHPDGTVRWLRSLGDGKPGPGTMPALIRGLISDGTQSKLAEIALVDSEQRARAALDELDAIYRTAPVGLGLVDRELRYRRVNPALADVKNQRPEDLLGQHVYERWPDMWETWEPIYRAVLDDGEAFTDIPVCVPGTGGQEARHWLASYHPVMDADGTISGVTVAVREVTASRRAEAALWETASRYRAAVEAGPHMASIMRPDGSMSFFSEHWRDFFGADVRDVTLDDLMERVHPGDARQVIASIVDALVNGDTFDVRFRCRRADGAWRWLHRRGVPARDEHGDIVEWVCATIDVTESQKTEDAQRLLLNVVERSEDLIATADLNGRLTYMNPAGRGMVGLPPDADLRAISFYDYTAPPDHALLRDVALPAARDTGAWHGAMRLVNMTTGALIDVQRTTFALRDANGTLTGYGTMTRDVTQARRAEHQLQATLAELQSVYETAPIGLCVFDTGLRFRRINTRLAEIHGIPAEDHIGRHLRDIVPQIADQVEQQLRGVLETGEPALNMEVAGQTPARPGETRCWNASYLPLRDGPAGTITGVYVVAEEITEDRAAAARLAESEANFRALADALPSIVFVTNPRGLNIYVNAYFSTFSGHSQSDLLQVGWLTAVHPADREKAVTRWRQSIASEAPYEIDYRLLRHDGTWRWFLVRAVAQRDESGRVTRWIGVGTDVDDVRTAEAALSGARERLRLAHDAADLGTWSWDIFTNRLELSDRGRALYGVPDAILTGFGDLLERLHPDDRRPTEQAIARALADHTDYDVEHRVTRADGSSHWLRARGRGEFRPDGEPLALRGVVLSINREKQAEELLHRHKLLLEEEVAERTEALSRAAAELAAEMRRREEAQAALTHAQKLEALGHLTGGVAHDFNNLLSAILGSLELISVRAKDDDRILRFATNARQAADRAAALIRQLLAFARREEPVPEAINPANLMASADELVRQAVGAAIRVNLDVPPDIWPVLVDVHRLEVALLNLAVNARDAMAGDGSLFLRVRNEAGTDALAQSEPTQSEPAQPELAQPELGQSEKAGSARLPPGINPSADYVVVSLRDTGPGMPPEILARATEPFFTTKARGHGTGLGLAMVQGFVEQSGGGLGIISEAGAGTTVELWLPRSAHAGRPRQLERPEPDPGLHGNAAILVVDDNDSVRIVTATLLRDLGYRVLEASSADAAIVQASAFDRVDMVVTDVMMAGGDGISLAARLRARWPDLPIIFVTGFAYRDGLQGETVLAKPFTPAMLAEQVLIALGRLPRTRRRPNDRLLERLVRPDLREAYLMWHSLREQEGFEGWLPQFQSLNLAALPAGDHAYVVAVDGDAGKPIFRFEHVGSAITARLGLSLQGSEIVADDDELEAFRGLAAAYAYCARAGVPGYDYTRFGSGDAATMFERLLLPFARDGGPAPTHLVGLVFFPED